MPNCDYKCDSCLKDCDVRNQSFLMTPNDMSNIKKTIAIVSGKGGVGKSLITSLLAISKAKENKNVAIMDADITGASIPKSFGIHKSLSGDGKYIYPCISKGGIKIVSSNLILEDESDPIIYRGPLIASMVKQFYSDVAYGDIDYLFIDMPPGTGDVSLTVFQSINIDGIIIVTTPQDLVAMIVEKAIKMANMMNIRVLGIIENMSYVKCKKCDEIIEVFGKSHLDEIVKKYNLKILARIPIDSNITSLCDKGDIESIKNTYLENIDI